MSLILNDCCPHLSLQNQAGWREARASAYTRPSRHWPGSLTPPPVRLRSQCCRGEAASSMVTMVTAVSLAHYRDTCSPPRVPVHTGPWSPAGVTVPRLQSAPARCSYIGRISPPHPWPTQLIVAPSMQPAVLQSSVYANIEIKSLQSIVCWAQRHSLHAERSSVNI